MSEQLKAYYKNQVVAKLQQELGLKNVNQVPHLEKIVVTTCVGSFSDRKQAVEDAVAEIAKITGQRPSVTYAKRSVSNFKLRQGEALGARVTLRGDYMWNFLNKFIHVVAPNMRDFRGISPKSFDGQGNYALGIKDQSIFPEITLDKIKRQLGFDLIFVTSAKTNEQGKALLTALGMPFIEPKKKEEPVLEEIKA